MLPQVQQMVNDVLLSKYKGKNKALFEVILNTMFNSFVAVNDDLWITTHSMPSGSFLTALFNSLVNKAYTAMWFFRYAKNREIKDFFQNIIDYVLGDDKIGGCKDSQETSLNALTMRDFYTSIGLDATDSKKQKITKPFDDINDVTFLKRSFRYHPKLGKIVCPLDMKSIDSTISWYDSDKVYTDVIKDKLHAVQREYFLHHEVYESKIRILEQECKSRGHFFVRLPESYLMYLYEEMPDYWGFNFGGTKYV